MAIVNKLFDTNSLLSGVGDILYTNLNEINDIMVEYVSIDSRNILNENSLFICHSGVKNDGHDFIEDAFIARASCVIVEKFNPEIETKIKKFNRGVIYVKNSLQALHNLAKFRRDMLKKTKFIALTGSAGKTTVKDMISVCLSGFSVHSSYKSYNNEFGVPLTIVNTPDDCSVSIVEIGTNHIGEVASLVSLVNPDIAMITSIGRAHIGNFSNGIEDIIKEKTSIFRGLKHSGVAIINEDNEFFKEVLSETIAIGVKNIIRVGKKESSHLYIEDYSFSNYFTTDLNVAVKEASGIKTVSLSLNGLAYHNMINILFAFAIGRLFRMSPESMAKVLNGLPITEGRGNVEHLCVDKKRIMIINDTHNCSFEALSSAIQVLKILKKQNPEKRVVCFLGDIGEVNGYEKEYYEKIADLILNSGIDKVYCVGTGMKYLFDKLPKDIAGNHFENVVALSKGIRRLVNDKDICLFKAKRVITIEKAIEKLCMS